MVDLIFVIFQALMFFSEKIATAPEQTSLWKPKEMENFKVAKCCAIVRMTEFFTLLLEKGQISVLEPFWGANFWQILSR